MCVSTKWLDGWQTGTGHWLRQRPTTFLHTPAAHHMYLQLWVLACKHWTKSNVYSHFKCVLLVSSMYRVIFMFFHALKPRVTFTVTSSVLLVSSMYQVIFVFSRTETIMCIVKTWTILLQSLVGTVHKCRLDQENKVRSNSNGFFDHRAISSEWPTRIWLQRRRAELAVVMDA